MKDSHPAAYMTTSTANDGDLVFVTLAYGHVYPGIKGTRDDKAFVAILADTVFNALRDRLDGPWLAFGDEPCVSFGNEFVLEYEPSPENFEFLVETPALGRLAVINEGVCIVCHSTSGKGLVQIDTGAEHPNQPCAVVTSWKIGLRQYDDTIAWLYEKKTG